MPSPGCPEACPAHIRELLIRGVMGKATAEGSINDDLPTLDSCCRDLRVLLPDVIPTPSSPYA